MRSAKCRRAVIRSIGTICATAVLAGIVTLAPVPLLSSPVAAQAANGISIDADAERGLVQPTVVGQMMEWAKPNHNETWAERLENRSFERDEILKSRSSLYDSFEHGSLLTSKWTPWKLDSTYSAATVSISSGKLTSPSPRTTIMPE